MLLGHVFVSGVSEKLLSLSALSNMYRKVRIHVQTQQIIRLFVAKITLYETERLTEVGSKSKVYKCLQIHDWLFNYVLGKLVIKSPGV